MSLFTKFLLPTPVSFIRYIQRILVLNHKVGRDTDTTLVPIVSRAKNLVTRQGVSITTHEKIEEEA